MAAVSKHITEGKKADFSRQASARQLERQSESNVHVI